MWVGFVHRVLSQPEWSWESHLPGRVRNLRFQLAFVVVLLGNF